MDPWTAENLVWDVWIVSWVVAILWSAPTSERPSWRIQAPNLAVTAVGALLLFNQRPGSPTNLFRLWWTPIPGAWTLVGVSVLGFAFCWWARIHLGRLWSGTVTRKVGHHVVDTGPYGIVRHPIYTGILLVSFGQAAMDGTAGAFVGAALMTWGFSIKARLEESFLKGTLEPGAYEAYLARIPMLVPSLRSLSARPER